MGRNRPPHHVLVASFPERDDVNAALQFAKKLVCSGTYVTFFSSFSARQHMVLGGDDDATPEPAFALFKDGSKPGDDSQMETLGSEELRDTLFYSNCDVEGLGIGGRRRPVTFLVCTPRCRWALKVARKFNVPRALLWAEPAGTALCIYHDADEEIELPRLPMLSDQAPPSFLLLSTPERYWLLMKKRLSAIDDDEYDKLIRLGFLLPSGGDPSSGHNYLEWLDAKPKSSVVYVSFGSLPKLPKAHMEEIAKGLLLSGRPFLWVIPSVNKEKLSCIKQLKLAGKIVSCCSLLEVLRHPSVGCFVTHCEWIPAVESLSIGVPVVAKPLCFDQEMNAKLMEEVWRTGVRVKINEGFEIKRGIEMVMGEVGENNYVRENARKWYNSWFCCSLPFFLS